MTLLTTLVASILFAIALHLFGRKTVLALVGFEDLVGVDAEVPEGVDGNQDMADIGVYFTSFESLFQVLVDGFVGYFAQEGQVGNTNLLLLGCLKGGLLGLRASACAVGGCPGALVLRAS